MASIKEDDEDDERTRHARHTHVLNITYTHFQPTSARLRGRRIQRRVDARDPTRWARSPAASPRVRRRRRRDARACLASDVDADLGADVKAFASTLGFAPSAASGDVAREFDDRDFRAEHCDEKRARRRGRRKRRVRVRTRTSRVRGNRAKGVDGSARWRRSDGDGDRGETGTRKVSEGDKARRGEAGVGEETTVESGRWTDADEESGGDAKNGRARDGAGASGGAWYETVAASPDSAANKDNAPSRGELGRRKVARRWKSAWVRTRSGYSVRATRTKWLEMVRTSDAAATR